MPTSISHHILAEREAARQAEEQARRSGDTLAVLHASRRVAAAEGAYLTAEAASLTEAEAAERENDLQGAGYYSLAA
jgi:hypothetical protein